MTFYSCRSIPSGYRMVKFDNLLFVEATYDMRVRQGPETEIVVCSCPQANKPTCRHRQMLEDFIMTNRVNSGWFWDFENERWEPPIDQYSIKAKGNALREYARANGLAVTELEWL